MESAVMTFVAHCTALNTSSALILKVTESILCVKAFVDKPSGAFSELWRSFGRVLAELLRSFGGTFAVSFCYKLSLWAFPMSFRYELSL